MKKLIISCFLIASMLCSMIIVSASGAVYENVALLNPSDVTAGTCLNQGVIVLSAVRDSFSPVYTTAYFDIDDTVVNGNAERYAVQIDVDYYDGGKGGYFYLTYDSFENSSKQSTDYGSVFGTPEGTDGIKKTKTFILYDAKMGNGMINSADFSITSNLYDINIFAVRAKVLSVKTPVSVMAESDSAGNIFFDGDKRELVLNFKNNSANGQSFTASYKIYEQDTDSVTDCGSDTFTASGGESIKKEFTPPVTRYGCYILKVTLSGDVGGVFDIPFSLSVVNTSDTRSERLGVSSHIRYCTDTDGELSIIDKAGFNGIRTEYDWMKFEKVKANPVVYGDADDNPVFEEPENYTRYIDGAIGRGLDMKVIFTGGHHNYKNAAGEKPSQFDMADCESQRKAYARALSAMLEINSDKISTIEILNEPDLTGSNRQGLDPEYYVKLVKDTYNAVKPIYPNVELAPYAVGNLWETRAECWFNGSFPLDTDNDGFYDMAQYSDAFAAHPYVKTFIDESRNIQNAYEDADILKAELEKYACSDKPIYYTEYGFSSSYALGGADNLGVWYEMSDREHAGRIVRNTLEMFGKNMGDRFYIYNLAETGMSDNYSEHTYALTESTECEYPYAAKPGLIAIANLNELIGGYETCETIAHDENKSVYKFADGTGREVYTFSAENAESYSFVSENTSENILFCDMYGNALSFEECNGAYELTLTNEPIYAVVGGDQPRAGKTVSDGNVLVAVQFPNANIGDSATAVVYDEFGSEIEARSLVLNDRKCCFISMAYDDAETYIIEYTTPSLEEPYRYIIKGDKSIDVTVKTEGNQMSVRAKFPSAEAYAAVALEVLNAEGNAVYYNQLYLDEARECSCVCYVPGSAEYTVRLGTNVLDAVYVTGADGNRVIFSVIKGTSRPQTFSELIADGLAPVVSVEFVEETDDFSLIIAGFSDNQLSNVRVIKKEEMTEDKANPNKMTYTIDKSILNNAQGAKFFIVNSMQTMEPFGKAIVFDEG